MDIYADKDFYNVNEFIRLTPAQKQRLRARDPEQYETLYDKANKDFALNEDPACLAGTKER